ncbi:MAG: response regulator [Granulosicoccus sp.]|nr:response regulator [Granulosicoccus sp.]
MNAMLSEDAKRSVILVVEDSPESLGMLHETLERGGYTVLLAPNGERALEIVTHIRPDGILMDALLPGMNGFETTRRIKQLANARVTPVLFMTGLDDTEHIVEGLEAGGVDYIVKPINATEMIARLKVHMDNAQDAQTAKAALEISGQSIIAADLKGRVIWATPSVRKRFIPGVTKLRSQTLAWLRQIALQAELNNYSEPYIETDCRGQSAQLIYLGQSGNQQYLMRVRDHGENTTRSVIKDYFELTGREADVLLWLVNGKSNKEIGEILSISPRTVNKYLDHVYVKLGVENRTAAAMVTMRRIADHLYG